MVSGVTTIGEDMHTHLPGPDLNVVVRWAVEKRRDQAVDWVSQNREVLPFPPDNLQRIPGTTEEIIGIKRQRSGERGRGSIVTLLSGAFIWFPWGEGRTGKSDALDRPDNREVTVNPGKSFSTKT